MTQSTDHSGNAEADGPHAYEVLARKYRPRSFADLIGHGAMVRTLENAFSAGRIAHAYIPVSYTHLTLPTTPYV